eukprot:238128-Chlamydomonas_euryale.AAC.1
MPQCWLGQSIEIYSSPSLPAGTANLALGTFLLSYGRLYWVGRPHPPTAATRNEVNAPTTAAHTPEREVGGEQQPSNRPEADQRAAAVQVFEKRRHHECAHQRHERPDQHARCAHHFAVARQAGRQRDQQRGRCRHPGGHRQNQARHIMSTECAHQAALHAQHQQQR